MNLIRRGSKIGAKKHEDMVVVNNEQINKVLEEAQKQLSVVLTAQEKEREISLRAKIDVIEKEKNEALISLQKEQVAKTLLESKLEEEITARKAVEKEKTDLLAAKFQVEKERDEVRAAAFLVEKELATEREAKAAVEKERDALLKRKDEVEKGVLQLLGLNKK